MAKKNGDLNLNWHCNSCCSGAAVALILIGAAYALQNAGVLFSNVVLWPWVLIALGICTYLFKRR